VITPFMHRLKWILKYSVIKYGVVPTFQHREISGEYTTNVSFMD